MKPKKLLLILSVCALMLGGGLLWAKHHVAEMLSYPSYISISIAALEKNIDIRAVSEVKNQEITLPIARTQSSNATKPHVVTTAGANPCDPQFCNYAKQEQIKVTVKNLEAEDDIAMQNEGLIRTLKMQVHNRD